MTNVELLPDVVRDVQGVPRSAAMKALAVGLLLASGCNQIFGLHDDLQPRDARFVDFQDGMYWPMYLTWQLVADPSGAVTYPAIDGATVAIGPIDPTMGPMVNLPVDPMTGMFLLPRDTPNQPYRLVYTVDSLPTELQSTLNTGHFVVPMVGRIDREPTPSHALLEFDPMPPPPVNPIPNSRILTAGLWTTSFHPNGDQINMPYTYDYQANGLSMAGTQGSLRQDRGDVEIACSTTIDGDVTGYAVMAVDHLVENGQGLATAASTWMTPLPTTVKWITPNDNSGLEPVGRLTAAVNNYGGTVTTKLEWAGVIPSSIMPNFIQPNPGGLDGFQLAPLSKYAGVNPHTFVNPFPTAVTGALPTALPTAAFVQNTSTRTTGSGAKLTSGFQAIGLPPSPTATVDMHYAVGIAHQSGNDVTLKPEGGTSKILTGADNTIVVALGGATLVDLTFGTDQAVDDCVATIYQIAGASVTPVRRLLLRELPTPNSPFKIDASVFVPATTYTLGIVCRKGQTGIASGDYTMVSYPYMTSTLYTPTFTVTP
jgi:hypothetical protein